MPTLYIFAISHFCEKARWALDYLDIEYELAYLAPGLHSMWAKRRGLDSTTLPTLAVGGQYIQGSDKIINWADANTRSSRRLTPAVDAEEVLTLERRLGDTVGVHTRRMFYSNALLDHPATVRPVFTRDLVGAPRLFTLAMWPVIRKVMIRAMDLGPAQGQQSRDILEGELDWLDSMLADGRRFLVGDTLSRADLAASALFSRIAGAEQHPLAEFLSLPPHVAELVKPWRDRPTMQWIHRNYAEFR